MSVHSAKGRLGTKVTAPSLRQMKERRERITMVTAYDALFARLVERGGAEVILVGDSLGMVVQGHANTLSVTLEDIIYHTRAVVRGASRAHIVADMPFMSYQADTTEAVRNAGRLVKEGGAHAVKLEGGSEYHNLIEHIVRIGIPVMGHIGLTPQSVHTMGGFKVQGRDTDAASRILEAAQALEAAGAYAIVLEGIPDELAKVVTRTIDIPTIGIGAGVHCDGQVLVLQDLLGMDLDFSPKFVKHYARLGETVAEAVNAYSEEVKAGTFPGEEHTFHAKSPLFGLREVASDAQADKNGVELIPV